MDKDNKITNFFVQWLHHSMILLSAFFFSVLLIWGFLVSFSNYNGGEIFKVFFYEAFVYSERLENILIIFAPLLIAAIGFWICFKMGILNLGISGQMAVAALTVYLVGYFIKQKTPLKEEHSVLWLIILMLVAIVAAVLFSMIIAILKTYFQINEIISAILLNYIIFYLFRYVMSWELIVDPVTKTFSKESLGAIINFQTDVSFVTINLILAAIIFIIIGLVFYKSKIGLQITVMGKSNKAARYGGINWKKQTMIVFLLAGILSGLSGFLYHYRDLENGYLWKPETMPTHSFDIITIGLLAGGTWINLPISAFLITILRVQQKMIRISMLDSTIVDIMIGLIILMVALATRILTDSFFKKQLQTILHWSDWRDRKTVFLTTNTKTTKLHKETSNQQQKQNYLTTKKAMEKSTYAQQKPLLPLQKQNADKK